MSSFPSAVSASGVVPPVVARSIIAKHERANEERQVVVERTKSVIRIWEKAQAHELSQVRMREFRKRDEMVDLIEFELDELEVAAALTMKAHNGLLRLADWLAVATERQEIHRVREERRAGIKEQGERRCPACDYFERSCFCN